MSDHNDEVFRQYKEAGKKKHKMGFKFWIFHILMTWIILVSLGGPRCPTPGPCELSTIDHVIAWSYILGIPYIQYLRRKYNGFTGMIRIRKDLDFD